MGAHRARVKLDDLIVAEVGDHVVRLRRRQVRVVDGRDVGDEARRPLVHVAELEGECVQLLLGEVGVVGKDKVVRRTRRAKPSLL